MIAMHELNCMFLLQRNIEMLLKSKCLRQNKGYRAFFQRSPFWEIVKQAFKHISYSPR